ncbi:MAG: hypothetical protein PHV11_03395 [Candidatus Bipolaricaulis sp.]|nr:hypothetical protein [Candidatus Bipolaricaulis sp.]
MNLSCWSDEERWFVPRALGFGYSLNLKHVARTLGWIRSAVPSIPLESVAPGPGEDRVESRQDRLRRQADESKYEVRR